MGGSARRGAAGDAAITLIGVECGGFGGTGRTGAQLAGDRGVGAWPVADRSTRHRRQCWHSSWKSAGSVPAWVPSDEVSVANLFRLDVTGVQMACLSYLEPSSFTNARYLVRRLRRRLPQAKIVDGFWTLTPQEVEQRDALAATRADCVVTSLRQAVEQVVNAAKEAPSADLERENRAPTAAARAKNDKTTTSEAARAALDRRVRLTTFVVVGAVAAVVIAVAAVVIARAVALLRPFAVALVGFMPADHAADTGPE